MTLIGSNLVDKTLNPWIGKVDEVRIWNDARTQDEIQEWMNKTLVVGNVTGLIAYYPMDVNNNCLLYTSPSPRDVEESRMPSSA